MSTPDMKSEDASADTLQTRLMSVEEEVAHLTKTVDELSDIIARQETTLDAFTRRVEMLMQREAGRESDGAGSIALADQRPPHW
jgi:SlyX protein